ncbi:peptidoglycan glycosyltransferase [Aurantiacibacter atlanticus]|uniref:Peptidoglycan glycosyltransferase n=1 Tax=Aurantiacibacter atlanticus TaxID=1648404 RepID=A0A0H4VD29_9SPHN|nr:penicillin-binding protein 2 [Aurantiacibacter atlanticus]AKQ42622.1 peptidoglycan glycosyltransferase [Aurantiacibacter atlanticus]MDF1835315.1 penicillin-binding protein 2 [Alteraurantiacibacter sp. bin_em_oilr2.035]
MTAYAAQRTVITAQGGLVDHRRRSLLVARLRLLLIIAVFLLVAIAALFKLTWIGVVQPGPAQQSMADALLPPRGEITDRNGVPLARAFPAYALWYNPAAMTEGGDGGPPLVGPPEEVARKLVDIFPDLDLYEVTAKLESGQRGYLRRRVLPDDANKVTALGELALELPQEEDRHYPQGSLAAHVLGYVGADGNGRVGMEQFFNERLLDPARRADPVALSIDMRVQGALEDELRRGMLSVNALGAAGIVLDVDSGEVLALASLPEFDPNAVTQEDVILSPERSANGEMPRSFNRVTNQVYELGSTFKPLTVAIAIDAGLITDLGRSWQASRPLMVGGNPIRDSHTIGDRLNVPQTLIHSSNITSGQIAAEIGGPRMQDYFTQLGMAERAYIELPARGGTLGMNGKWNEAKAIYAGFGHGIAVTPLHLASAYAAMVNGGIWRPATLQRIEPGRVPRGRRVFRASTSARMNQLMRMIAVYGTGRNANAPGFRVGGKTGSAEKPGVGGYRRSTLVSTFAAAFPMDRPRFVVIAMLDEPKGTAASSYQRTAAWNAAPIVGRLVPRIGPQLGILPDADRDIDLSDVRSLVGGDR